MAKIESLHDLFVKELRDVYHAEKQITKSLPKMAKNAESEDLRMAFEDHLEETRRQVERLEQVFESLDERARAQRCAGMEGIIEESEELLGELDGPVNDAALVAAAQKVEHYEMAAYGTLETYARTLGLDQAAELLRETLEEEKATDKRLTQLAESNLNEHALTGGPGQADTMEEGSRRGATTGGNGGRRRR